LTVFTAAIRILQGEIGHKNRATLRLVAQGGETRTPTAHISGMEEIQLFDPANCSLVIEGALQPR
jgi:hypothetical protein